MIPSPFHPRMERNVSTDSSRAAQTSRAADNLPLPMRLRIAPDAIQAMRKPGHRGRIQDRPLGGIGFCAFLD